jgi:N6-L-threonylcarbamoyladenine synthase
MKYIIGIETSCDDSCIAVISIDGKLIDEVRFSQVKIHNSYGGVVPEIASRSHLEYMQIISRQIIESNNIKESDIVCVGATVGPGLIGALMVGTMFGKGIARYLNVPFIGINHLEGHIMSPKCEGINIDYPSLTLLISGGHCQLIIANDFGKYEIIGQTLDDSSGEAFDKIAKMLGLSYPGGPEIEKRAMLGNENRFKASSAMIDGSTNFSFSGFKTSTMKMIQDINNVTEQDICDICAVVQKGITNALIAKSSVAIDKFKEIYPLAKSFVLCGGVSANKYIVSEFEKLCGYKDMILIKPSLKYATDNASMIAVATLERYNRGLFSDLSTETKSRWPLDEL